MPGEALVRVRKVGICGSDLHAFAGRHPAYTYPRILGHELSGEVVEAPANDRGIGICTPFYERDCQVHTSSYATVAWQPAPGPERNKIR